MSKTETETQTQTEETKVVEETTENETIDKITNVLTQLEEVAKTVRTLTNDLKNVKKDHAKLVKKYTALQKSKSRKNKSKEGREASAKTGGFTKPVEVSKELADFLGLAEGETVSRPNVTSRINKYIKEHKLQHEGDGKKFDMTRPGGEKLAEIFGVAREMELDIFKMQTYLTQHYPKSEKSKKASGEVETETKPAETKPAEAKPAEAKPAEGGERRRRPRAAA